MAGPVGESATAASEEWKAEVLRAGRWTGDRWTEFLRIPVIDQ